MHEARETMTVESARQRLLEWQDKFWEAIRAGDQEAATRLQMAVETFPDVVEAELWDHASVPDVWGAVRADTGVRVGLLLMVEASPQVWQAKSECDRLAREAQAARVGRNHTAGKDDANQPQEFHQRIHEYFASLVPDIRQHPVIRHALSRLMASIPGIHAEHPPLLSENETAEVRFRRMYRWTEDVRPARFTVEIRAPAAEAYEPLQAERLMEMRIRNAVAMSRGHVLSLHWLWEGSELRLLLAYALDAGVEWDAVDENLISGGLCPVHRSRRLLTTEELRFHNGFAFPFGDAFNVEDLSEDERHAFREYQARVANKSIGRESD